MKIGLLTFHRANNLGACLQAAALNKYINSHIGESEIIDLIPNNSCPKKEIFFFKYAKKIINFIFPKRNVTLKKRKIKFDIFRNEMMIISKTTYYGDNEMYKCSGLYDVLISGSDQILNTTLSGKTKAYYLDFDDNAKKISYASSFGRKDITGDEMKLIKDQLSKFSFLSVREQSGIDIIYNELNIKPILVVDPVFLLTADEWKIRCNSKMELPEKYIFVYSMEVSEYLESVVKQLKYDFKLPVIVVRGGGKSGRIEGIEDSICGPKEFLRYIKDAELVVTNSFHGTAFSIIFKKNFLCIAHSTRNARLESILSLTKNDRKLIGMGNMHTDCLDYIINGNEAYELLEDIIDSSKKYLKFSLKGEI